MVLEDEDCVPQGDLFQVGLSAACAVHALLMASCEAVGEACYRFVEIRLDVATPLPVPAQVFLTPAASVAMLALLQTGRLAPAGSGQRI